MPLRRAVPPFATGAHKVVHDGSLSKGRGLLVSKAGDFAVVAPVAVTAFKPKVLEPRLLLWSSVSFFRRSAAALSDSHHYDLSAFTV